jgi:hypothetical protein
MINRWEREPSIPLGSARLATCLSLHSVTDFRKSGTAGSAGPRVPPRPPCPAKTLGRCQGRQDQRRAHFSIGGKGWQWLAEQDLWDNIGRLTLETSVLSIVLIHLISSEAKTTSDTEALSHCRIGHVTILLVCRAHAAATTSSHVCIADALKARCVLAEVRWRWTLKVL